jgi:hypothetical protein
MMQNYLKKSLKNIRKHPKMDFYFWTKPIGACKKWKKSQTSYPNRFVFYSPLKTRQLTEFQQFKNLQIFYSR